MKWPSVLLGMIVMAMSLESPSCQRFHFQTGTIEMTNSHGDRTLHTAFKNGQIGKIGKGLLFRAELPDGGTVMIENTEAAQPEHGALVYQPGDYGTK